MYDLSILIPARNEMFLAETIKNILENIEGNTEVITVLDGAWADPPIVDDPRVTIIYHNESIGQRAATNEACKLSKAKYVMKCDAHCVFDKGFDVKMMAEMQDDWTMVPTLYNLHGFDWVCIGQNNHPGKLYYTKEEVDKLGRGCDQRDYQGPTPEKCKKCGGKMVRELVWQPRLSRRSYHYRFDKTLHFQYWGAFKNRPEGQGDISETLSLQGSCFMITRDKYWELDICEEAFGSWGQQGTEVACKTWLSGGRVVVNKKTWYSHMFRTQGGDFGFPYPQSGRQVEKARQYSRELFIGNKWPKAKHDLNWLLDKFKPVPDWHDEPKVETTPKGIIYYTDNKVPFKLGHACRKEMLKTKLPIVSVSLKPMNFGKNIRLKMERGYEAYFKQILTALENSTADIIYMCEHDWLYHQSHFNFTPSQKDTFYYNDNWWRVRVSDGFAITYDTHLCPGIVAYRELLLDHYRKAVSLLEKIGFSGSNARHIGFEPGTHQRVKEFANEKAESFKSEFPNLDLRHESNLTASRWSQDQFRNQSACQRWKEGWAHEIPGWKLPEGGLKF